MCARITKDSTRRTLRISPHLIESWSLLQTCRNDLVPRGDQRLHAAALPWLQVRFVEAYQSLSSLPLPLSL